MAIVTPFYCFALFLIGSDHQGLLKYGELCMDQAHYIWILESILTLQKIKYNKERAWHIPYTWVLTITYKIFLPKIDVGYDWASRYNYYVIGNTWDRWTWQMTPQGCKRPTPNCVIVYDMKHQIQFLRPINGIFFKEKGGNYYKLKEFYETPNARYELYLNPDSNKSIFLKCCRIIRESWILRAYWTILKKQC